MKKIIALLTVIGLMTSCNQTKKAVETTSNAVLTGNYTINTVHGNAISPAASLQFTNTDKAISGNTGCNDFGGNYSQDAMAINIGQLMATEAYCDDAIMKNEFAIMRALKNTGTFSISEEGILTLYSKKDRSAVLTATKEN